ncbi:hypothetical protein [Roseateles sp. LYH14W]|uniref:DUF4034 domain-containing protein n=1 Tax=Pelomonas parva TaxID=3299032 RepID=A0ABW7EZH3_9BURK
MNTRMLHALGAALLTLALSPAQAWIQDADKDSLAARAEQAMWWGDFEALEQLYVEAQKQPQTALNAWNGSHPVQSFRSGMASAFKYGNLNGAYFRELEKLTEGWARSRPDSVLAQLVYARALYAHAWHVRGTSYWQSVPAPAKAEFTRLIAKANKHLSDRAKLLMTDTSSHIYLVMIGRVSNWTFEQLEAIAEDSLRRSPADEDSLYEELAAELMPKWGGSWPELHRYVEAVDARTKARRGHEAYALLWSMVASSYDGNIFADLRADWPRIKQGYESLVAKRADPHYANRLAYLACTARALPAARAALAQLGDRADAGDWRGGGAAGTQNYEACVRWVNEAR